MTGFFGLHIQSLVNTGTLICESSEQSVAFKFILASLEVLRSSYSNGSWDRRQVLVHLLLVLLLSGFVQDSVQHSCVVPIMPFLYEFRSRQCGISIEYYGSSYSLEDILLFLSDKKDSHMIEKLSKAFHTFTRRILTSRSVDEMLLPRYMN